MRVIHCISPPSLIKSVKSQKNQIANFEMLRISRFDQTGYTIPKCDEEPMRLGSPI